ncbi:MAG: hypothetical protein KF777_17985 [Planctomycetaceae bacterium]|nr:hypothetical protein [Planctomycetaceae bacterium]
MPITIEYLAIFPRNDSFCDSATSFARLLQVDSKIKISSGEVKYDGQQACKFQLSDGEVPTKKQRYFHLHFTWDGDPDTDTDSLNRFNSLLKALRGAVRNAGGETETLWDDLSAHYARKAYPKIHEIENLMRRLIANFMLVTVGREWATETLPKAVEEAFKNSKRKDYLNVLDTVDFIHLGEFLFTAYSKKTPQDLYARLKDVKTEDDAKALQEFIPESNWKRYFGKLVTCEDGYLKTRWEKLYDLRCKVAHNALMTKSDLDGIEKLIGEVKPNLEQAIGKLSKVKVPAEEAEAVAENAARRVNATIGEFITCWQQLESELGNRLAMKGKPKKIISSGDDLVRFGVMDRSRIDQYNEVRRFRNGIVHGPSSEIPIDSIKTALYKLKDLLSVVESGYVEYLQNLSKEELETEIDSRISDTIHQIGDSEEFNSEIATTNATNFSFDEYEVEDIDFVDGECIVKLTYAASGEQMENKMYYGDRVVGECEAVIDSDGRVEYREVHAEVDHGDQDEPEFDPGLDDE